MDYGINLATAADSWKVVKRAEGLGFTRAWFYDTQLLNAEIFVAMGAAAVKTSRIRLGTGVLIPSNRIAPVAASALMSLNALAPGRQPFHTLNPALAVLRDGRIMAYGAMGGDGQPQTQAAVFTRHVLYRQPLADALDRPRWLLGRTWGSAITSLRMEDGFDGNTIDRMLAAGHDVDVLAEHHSDTMGHAGAVVLHPDGSLEGAHDPRADGGAVGI